jgi:hypothetical protein
LWGAEEGTHEISQNNFENPKYLAKSYNMFKVGGKEEHLVTT